MTYEYISSPLKAIVRYPDGYDKDARYPLLIFLHGSGSRGHDIELLRGNSFWEESEEAAGEFITLAPQCPAKTWTDCNERLMSLVLDFIERCDVDRDRVYLMGTSLGGYAAWSLCVSLSDVFAAVVPICGGIGAIPAMLGDISHVPVYAYHGELDDAVSVDEARLMMQAHLSNGGEGKLTVFEGEGHGIWNRVYSDPEVYRLLLSKRRRTPGSAYSETLCDSKVYG